MLREGVHRVMKEAPPLDAEAELRAELLAVVDRIVARDVQCLVMRSR